ncbi:MAG: MFS transporter [Janthinobacterium lividum]
MSTEVHTPAPPELPEAPHGVEPAHPRPGAHLAFLGLCCGVGVSAIYLCQPLLPQMGATFGASAAAAGQIGVATQVGYAVGMLTFTPLGDTKERRGLILKMFAAVSVALLLVACAPTLPLLLILSACTGAFASVTHIVLPIAPDLARPEERGRAVGIVMTGLLMGVLLARTFAGWLAELTAHLTTRIASWRVVFLVASLMSALLLPAIHRLMPRLPAKQQLNYREVMGSLWTLLREEPLLRESCVLGALAFGTFSTFWNTLAFVLQTHGLGAGVTGSFGLVGAAGTLIAASAGKLSDKRGPRYVISLALGSLGASFLGIYATERFATGAQAAGHLHIWTYLLTLAGMVVLLDIGMQALQLGNQTRNFSLQPTARTRINTLYMTSYFVGGAAASAVSPVLWQHFGITGLCVFEVSLILLAVLRHATGQPVPLPVGEKRDETLLHA